MKRSESDNALNSNQYTPAPYLNKMLQNSQNSQSEAVQLVGLGSAVGSPLGPVGTVVGGLIGGFLCIFVCHDGNFLGFFFVKNCIRFMFIRYPELVFNNQRWSNFQTHLHQTNLRTSQAVRKVDKKLTQKKGRQKQRFHGSHRLRLIQKMELWG